MVIDTLLVTSQAAVSGIFLIQYSIVCRWWKTVSGRMLAALVACLFTITLTLSVTNSNEGLSSSPLAVTLGRLGFTVTMLYGIVALELKRRRRAAKKKMEDAQDGVE